MESFSRRKFLLAGVAGSSIFLGLPPRARAQGATTRKFVFAVFDGGWDLLLGLDPRDPATTRADQHAIEPAYDRLAATYRTRGVQRRGALAFGPAVPPELLTHAADLSIVNAIGMDTAAHEVGRRYFLTGRFPRGLAAVGASTSAEIVAQQGDLSPIPHLSLAMEAYASGLPSFATALEANSLADLIVALTPFFAVDPVMLAAIEKYQDQSQGCEGVASTLIKNQRRARSYVESQLSGVFDLARTDAAMEALRTMYGIAGSAAVPDSPEVLAFVAGQALKANISQSVSVRIARDLDTHSNWAEDHAPRLERGLRALAALITDLKSTPSTTDTSRSLFEETTIVAFSEFGRTPLFNNLNGRDHFLGNSCLITGAGVRRGVTIGRSASVGMMPLATDLSTGEGFEQSTQPQLAEGRVVTLSPKHVLATVLTSAGLDASYLRAPAITALLG